MSVKITAFRKKNMRRIVVGETFDLTKRKRSKRKSFEKNKKLK